MPTAEIVRPAAFAPLAAAVRRQRDGVGIAAIGARLKMAHRPRRSIIDAIRLLVDKSGFPPPRSPRFVKGVRQTGSASVWALSVWDSDDVERWFDDDLPPAAAAAVEADRKAAVRHDLNRRALALAGAEERVGA